MAKFFLVWLFFVGTIAEAAAQGSYSETSSDGINVRTSCIMPKALLRGYVPVEMEFTNTNASGVTLDLELGDVQAYDDRAITTGSIYLEPGETKSIQWMAHFMETRYGLDRISLHVKTGAKTLAWLTVLQLDSGTANKSSSPLLAASDTPETFATDLNGIANLGKAIRAEGCEPGQLPTDWRAYSALQFVALDLTSTPPQAEQLQAIMDWVSTGGNLILIGSNQQARQLLASQESYLTDRKLISGHAGDEASRLVYRHHFGRIVTANEGGIAKNKLHHYFDSSGWNAANGININIAPPAGTFPLRVVAQNMQIPGLRTAPVAVLLGILLIFALIVGPMQLRRQKRKKSSPFRFLVITPLLGFGFSAAILSFNLLVQGIDVQEAWTSVTWLDQQSHQATTLSKRVTFSGSIFRNNLQYSSRTLAAPWPESNSTETKKTFTMNMDAGGTLEGHYLPVRLPTEQAISSVANARGRLEIEIENGSYFAVNGFDFNLTEFYYLNENGAWLTLVNTEDFIPGERRALQSTDAIPDIKFPVQPNVEFHIEKDEESPSYLSHLPIWGPPRRSYIAMIPTSPFVEDGGIDRRVLEQHNLLIGTLAEASK